eukprot:364284-Chlamydomonas_euryale.AAC.5
MPYTHWHPRRRRWRRRRPATAAGTIRAAARRLPGERAEERRRHVAAVDHRCGEADHQVAAFHLLVLVQLEDLAAAAGAQQNRRAE